MLSFRHLKGFSLLHPKVVRRVVPSDVRAVSEESRCAVLFLSPHLLRMNITTGQQQGKTSGNTKSNNGFDYQGVERSEGYGGAG